MMVVWSVLSFVIILGLLVLVHELGHFLVARWNKVGVDEFGFGFPPRVFGKRWGKTLYSLNAIPLGGFVKIKGVLEDDINGTALVTRAADDFMGKALWRRFSILIAGIIMNVLLTAVLFSVGFMIGMPATMSNLPANATVLDASIQVQQVAADVPAAAAGLAVGDVLTAVNGVPVTTVAAVKEQLKAITPDGTVTLTVQQNEVSRDLTTNTIQLSDGTAGIGAYFVETGRIRLPWYSAIVEGFKQTGSLSLALFQALGGIIVSLVQGQDVSGVVAGPVGIAADTYQVTQLGFVYLLQFAALLSLNLAIFNLLPFPPLDGGKLIFVVLEAITRKPVPMKWQVLVHNIGFILFLILIMAVTVKDVFGLVS
jgi:regulator of sigma E protease